MSTPRSLLSLNQDVLREILAYLLLDTRGRNRTAILRTSSLLHLLGLRLLYRVVDIVGRGSFFEIEESWKALFGHGSVLAQGTRRGVDVASSVREIRLGGVLPLRSLLFHQTHPFRLPNCSSLTLDLTTLPLASFPLIEPFLSHLPIIHLRLVNSPQFSDGDIGNFPIEHPTTLNKALFDESPPPWKQLESVAFVNATWSEHSVIRSTSHLRISLSSWSFKLLIVEVAPGRAVGARAARGTLSLFLPPDISARERFLEEVERIEFRMGRWPGKAAEEKFREEVKRRVARGLTSLEKRLLPMFVFVWEDGTEGRFEDLE